MNSSLPPMPRQPGAHKRSHIAGCLREMVAGLKAGDRLPSVPALEKHFGVAKSTVEAAVGDLRSEGLIVSRKGSGTFVAGTAPVPAPPMHSGRIIISTPPLGSSLTIYSAMVEALEAEIRRQGFDALLQSDVSTTVRLAKAQQRWEEGHADGYVHIGSVPEAGTVFPTARGVVMGEIPDGAKVHQVAVDSYGGGRRAAEYLWGLGHRHIAFLALENTTPGPRRFQGLADALSDYGGQAKAIYAPVVWRQTARTDIPSLEMALRTLLDGPSPPTALFFGNDQVAFPALQTLLSWGYRIPQDISVLSFDDTPGLASHIRPALTGLRMPTFALGAMAVQTLLEAIREPDLPFRRLHLPAELIVRESSGPPPHNNDVTVTHGFLKGTQ